MSSLSSQACTPSMQWNKFPAELHHMILANLSDSGDGRSELPKFATVSKEWQAFFEPVTFASLTFRNYRRMCDMNCKVRGARRGYVKSIWLQYEADARPEQSADMARCRNDIFFTTAVLQLFDELSYWEPSAQGLAPEISASSASRAENGDPNTCRSFRRSTRSGAAEQAMNGWAPFRPDEAFSLDLFALPRFPKLSSLPPVRAVTSLSIRKDKHYHFSDHDTISNTITTILSSLPRLEHFEHHYWRGVRGDMTPKERRQRADENELMVLDCFPTLHSLRSVSIFEDFTCCFRDELKDARHPQLGEAFARRSQEFDELHLSRNVDALDFFSAFAESPVPPLEEPGDRAKGWPNMRYLSMTATALLDGEELQPLLRLVALAVETMPRSRSWSCGAW